MKIVMEHLTKRFPNSDRKQPDVIAVNDFNIEIPDGKLVALLGPSGCGKSTCLNLLCGLLEATSGKIWFGDEDVTDLSPENRGVGIVFQNYALYPHLTVYDNIIFPLQNFKGKDHLSTEEMDQRVHEAAKLVQIEQYMARKPKQLSGGQQQRVAIARAIVKRPKILLLDEPLSNLDARLRLQTREEIRRIQKETGITTIFVTHDQEEAMSISDLIIVMQAGVINQVGKPQEVYDDPVNMFVAKFLGTPPINMFDGKVKDGQLWIGDEAVLDITGVKDQEVYVGIRPEGFILNENGRFTCRLEAVEVSGRDTSIVSKHDQNLGVSIRSIISAENQVDRDAKTVRFDLKPFKVYLFDKQTEERLRFGVPQEKA